MAQEGFSASVLEVLVSSSTWVVFSSPQTNPLSLGLEMGWDAMRRYIYLVDMYARILS